MKIRVKDKLYIHDPISKVVEYCRDKLIIDNPDYYKLEKMGKWTGNTPQKIWLYESFNNNQDLWLPFGCLKDIWSMHPVQADYTIEIAPIRRLQYESNIKLYEYQRNAVNAVLVAKNGILVMPCGSGKTQCGLEIISRIGGRALWLTHTQDLLNQSKARAESVLSGAAFGSITAGKVNIGTHITFATVQTMCKLDLSAYRDQWDVIIVDECQHCCGTPTRVTQFYKVVSRLSARYKIGLTATPKRSDGLHQSMFALLGGKIFEVTKADVAHTTCPVKVQVVETGWMPDYDAVLMGDGTIDYSKLIDNMVNDTNRLCVVINAINIIPKGSPIMVLANRIVYLEQLLSLYDGKAVCLSGQGQSKKTKAERKAALEKLNNGDLDCVFATYQLAKEGLDVPNLRYVIFATPEQNETTVIQSVGRVGRKAAGKEYGTVVDFVDDFGMYIGWFNKRKRYYKKIAAEVVE